MKEINWRNCGVMIIKPDACTEEYFDYFQMLMRENDLNDYQLFKFDNYAKEMVVLQMKDLEAKNGVFKDTKLLGGSFLALEAYQELFQDAHGYAVVIDLKEKSKDEAYYAMDTVKLDFRSKIASDRKGFYAYVNMRRDKTVKFMGQKEFDWLADIDKGNIKKVNINGIFLEDRKAFEKNLSFHYMDMKNVTTKENFVYTNLKNYSTKSADEGMNR